MPLLDVVTGSPELDANNRAIFWFGRISPDTSWAQVRLVGSNDGLHVRAQIAVQHPSQGAMFAIGFNEAMSATFYPFGTPGWTIESRCTGTECRGWTATRTIPWAELGGRPQVGDTWTLAAEIDGNERWESALHWGLPNYAGVLNDKMVVQEIALSADGTLGGSTDCGKYDYPDYFTGWGDRNYAGTPEDVFTNVQNQWDMADWPCYSQYIARWGISGIPADAEIINATLAMYKFGHSGYIGESTGINVIQAFEVSPDWAADTVTWNNAPPPLESISRTPVGECSAALCEPGDWHGFDVTEIIKRARAAQATDAAVLLYTAAGQYHSGRYFYTRNGPEILRPVVRVAYLLPTTPTPPPTATLVPPTQTPVPTATPTAPPPTNTPVPPTSTPLPTATPLPGAGKVYYVSTTGVDTNPGSITAPFATFNKAWKVLMPGDTLLIMDGIYHQPIWPNVRDGLPGKPITIQAMNDGKVTVTADGGPFALQLGESWPGPIGNFFVVRGIVFRDALDVILIYGHDNVLDRVSAYDADLNGNSSIITVAWSYNVLLQDVIAAGTGRKNILIFSSHDVTVRRAYVAWSRWDGGSFCQAGWPAGNGINPYSSSDILVENSIAIGPFAARAMNLTNQSTTAQTRGNRFRGDIAIGTYKQPDGSMYVYPWVDNACKYTNPPVMYPGNRAGMGSITQGDDQNSSWVDVHISGFADAGFILSRPFGPLGAANVLLDHATVFNNDLAGNGTREVVDDIGGRLTITNSYIEGSTIHTGPGARLEMRYVDGVLTNEPLWPWPMDGRALSEMGFRISEQILPYLGQG